jgi:metal-responsive CopG/Arc/MetJ family transcriptional regulator
MHYVFIIIIVITILSIQFSSFLNNFKKLSLFKTIFPQKQEELELQNDTALEIQSQHKNEIFDNIIFSINRYLNNNKGAVSDYHLIKDIVERNCYAKEEEIQTQIPVPLYLGLAGTMLGILIGIGFLVFSGGLNDLLNSGTDSGAKGIETLLGGVALAMISSIIGILLTTLSSHINKAAKIDVEKKKDGFLSWIQSELLPNISNDISSALTKMARNLSTFNNTFSQNTQELRTTLSTVNESYRTQADLIQAINKLRINEIASANIEVYDKLKNSTNEIGVFAQYLQNTNEYLKTIQALNHKLDDYEKRTQVIENAGRFFSKNEKWLAENFDAANLEVKAALERFKDQTGESLIKLQESLNVQILDYDGIVQQQQIVLKGKLQETSKLVEELKNLTHIKQSITHFEKATNRQNIKIDELAKEIRALAYAKTEGKSIKQIIQLPKWVKVLIISGSSLFLISCLFYMIPLLVEMIAKFINWLF